jgi:hypothetical protein
MKRIMGELEETKKKRITKRRLYNLMQKLFVFIFEENYQKKIMNFLMIIVLFHYILVFLFLFFIK